MEEKKYKSQSSGELVRADQYITELLITRRAASKNIKLPFKWWNSSDKYKKEFKQQLFWVRKILKTYLEEAIIVTLQKTEFQKIYSLNYPGLTDAILDTEEQIKNRKEQLQVEDNTLEQPMKKFNKKKINLKDLDE